MDVSYTDLAFPLGSVHAQKSGYNGRDGAERDFAMM